MSSEEIRSLIPQYISNQLNGAEKHVFEQRLAQDSDLRTEVAELREMWEGLGLLPLEYPSAAMRARFYRTLAEAAPVPRQPGRWWTIRWSSRFAPQVAGALALFLVGFYVRGSVDRGGAAEVTQLHAEVRSMREMLAVSLLDRQSASARLEGISWGRRVDHPDQQVATALLTALNHDANVNVRLSSVDALEGLGSDPFIRKALVDSVATQESPLVQIALIDALVQMHASEGAGELEKIARDSQYERSVSQHARWALQQLRNP